MLGLPDGIKALLFDLDGVLTDTARVHARAWKQMFEAHGYPFSQDDYDSYVDGKPREDGIRDFLATPRRAPVRGRDRRSSATRRTRSSST